jgi:hypothetical protein
MARRLAPVRWSPHAEAVSEPGRTDTEPTQPLETAMLRPPIDELPDDRSETATVDVEAKQTSEFDDTDSHLPNEAELAAERRSGGWKLKVSALTLVGVAMTGAIFALKGGALGLPKSPPVIAAAQGLTKVQPSSDENVATSGDAGATLLKDSTQPGSEEQPIRVGAERPSRREHREIGAEENQEHIAPRPFGGIAGALVVDAEPEVDREQRCGYAREPHEQTDDECGREAELGEVDEKIHKDEVRQDDVGHELAVNLEGGAPSRGCGRRCGRSGRGRTRAR